MHKGDIYLDGVNVVVVTKPESRQGVNQYNEEHTLSEESSPVLDYKSVLQQFKDTICKMMPAM